MGEGREGTASLSGVERTESQRTDSAGGGVHRFGDDCRKPGETGTT